MLVSSATPDGQLSLRLSVSAAHRSEHVEAAVAALTGALQSRFGPSILMPTLRSHFAEGKGMTAASATVASATAASTTVLANGPFGCIAHSHRGPLKQIGVAARLSNLLSGAVRGLMIERSRWQ